MGYDVTLIPGDGIGPEVTAAAVRVIDATGVGVRWERVEAGAEVLMKYGETIPEAVLQSIRRNGVGLKGPLTTPIGGGYTSPNVTLRKALDLYACLRPVKSLPGVPSRYEAIDLVVVRENTEGLYSGIEHRVVPGVIESLKIVTERAVLRIARFAFEYARLEGRSKITAVHKANIMKLSDGLFLECTRKVAREHPDITYDEIIIDNLCMQLVLNPYQFDLLLLENLYGDIVSEICSGLVGGLGVVPGANIGETCAVFEAVHGSAPQIAGKGIANPTAVILSGGLLLRHLGEDAAAQRIQRGVDRVLQEGRVRTPDLGGQATTEAFADAVIAAFE
ncbi:MAG: isocitrate dehydrogenase (NAD(+)) [Candidatus Latescibacteria bacterium]|nr:isocitrate dehydrogenase (NAD(+)) [Candidatus Latescibacterota bacterium]